MFTEKLMESVINLLLTEDDADTQAVRRTIQKGQYVNIVFCS